MGVQPLFYHGVQCYGDTDRTTAVLRFVPLSRLQPSARVQTLRISTKKQRSAMPRHKSARNGADTKPLLSFDCTDSTPASSSPPGKFDVNCGLLHCKQGT